MGLPRVCSLPQADNPRSARVVVRSGMRLLGEVKIAANDRRGELTALHFEIKRDEWLRLRGDVRRADGQ